MHLKKVRIFPLNGVVITSNMVTLKIDFEFSKTAETLCGTPAVYRVSDLYKTYPSEEMANPLTQS